MRPRDRYPVILLAFANDRTDGGQYLRDLPREQREIRQALAAVGAGDRRWTVVERMNATLDDLLTVFRDEDHRDRVAILHYGGHAESYGLLLEDADGAPALAHAGGLAAFLGAQRGLALVFLNGCSTREQVGGLLTAGVRAVVATVGPVEDAAATRFAAHFYAELARGDGLRRAFTKAVAAVRAGAGAWPATGPPGGMAPAAVSATVMAGGVPDGPLAAGAPADWPWELHTAPGDAEAGQWSLGTAAGDPLFGLPPVPRCDLPDRPFRHLLPFRREHAELFFGRGADIRALHDTVTAADSAPVVLLYGQTGVGKSSLLDAGLFPRLAATHAVRYARRDRTRGLAGTLSHALGVPDADAGDPAAIAAAWHHVEHDGGRPLVVVVDQVEEAFTVVDGDAVAARDPSRELAAFATAIAAVLGDPRRRPRGRLVLGFRKEWLADVESALGARQVPRAKQFLTRLTRAGIMDAISGPTRTARLRARYALTVEDGLAEVIADDLLADRASHVAPVLQILLAEMWELAVRCDGSRPLFDHRLYDELRARGLHLEGFLAQQLAALRAWDPPTVDSGLALDYLAFHTTPLGTAQARAAAEEVGRYPHASSRPPGLREQCLRLYLLTEDAADGERDRTTRLAHDTLAPLVRRQLEESPADGPRARRVLESRAAEWADGRTAAPLDEHDLALVERGAVGMRAWLPHERRLVAASRDARALRRRSRRRLRLGAAALATLVLLSGVVAWVQYGTARRRAAEAESRELAARAGALLPGQLDLALLLGVAAVERSPTLEAHGTLLAALESTPTRLVSVLRASAPLAFGPDGEWVASGDETGTIVLLDPAHDERPDTIGRLGTAVGEIAVSPDGRWLAAADTADVVVLWDLARRPRPAPDTLVPPQDGFTPPPILTFSQDGQRLATVGRPSASEADRFPLASAVLLWHLTRRQRPDTVHRSPNILSALAFGPDGERLAMGDAGGVIALLDLSGRAPPDTLDDHGADFGIVSALAFTPGGQALVAGVPAASSRGLLVVWDLVGRSPPDTIAVLGGWVRALALPTQQRWLAFGDGSGGVGRWPIPGAPLESLTRMGASVRALAVSADGRRLAAADADGVVTRWDLTRRPETARGARTVVADESFAGFRSLAALGPHGRRLVMASRRGMVVSWALARGGRPDTLARAGARVTALALTADDRRVAAGDTTGAVVLWSLAPGAPRGADTLARAGPPVSRLTFDPDGRILAVGDDGGGLALRTLDRVERPERRARMRAAVTALALGPDGRRFVAADTSGLVMLWEQSRWARPDTLARAGPHVSALAFSAGGRWLATGSRRGVVVLRDLARRLPPDTLAEAGGSVTAARVGALAFSPDGQRLVAGAEDGTVALWDVPARRRIGTVRLHEHPIAAVGITPDGHALLAAVRHEAAVVSYPLRITDWLDRACTIAGWGATRSRWPRLMPTYPFPEHCRHRPGDVAVATVQR